MNRVSAVASLVAALGLGAVALPSCDGLAPERSGRILQVDSDSVWFEEVRPSYEGMLGQQYRAFFDAIPEDCIVGHSATARGYYTTTFEPHHMNALSIRCGPQAHLPR